MTTDINILTIADYYPDKFNPTRSLWIYEQVERLIGYGYNSLVVSPSPYIPQIIRRYYSNKPQVNYQVEEYKNTYVSRPAVIKFPKNYFYNVSLYSLKIAINFSAKKIKPKLIHAHFGPNGIGAVELKKKMNIPLITSFYGYDSGRLGNFLKKYYKDLINHGDIFLALSKNMKQDLIDLGFPENRIYVQHLGIDPDKLKKRPSDKKVKFVFTIVARLDEVKGIQDAIKAFNIVKKIKKDVELHIVGDGVYKEYLLLLVNELKLNESVIFINNFTSNNPRDTVLNELNNCDAFLLTSFTTKTGAKEGTPIVLMEAQAFSKPCIATRHAGIPEVVIDKKTGILVNERDVSGIAEAMILLNQNKKLRNELGSYAREFIEKEFNSTLQTKKIADIYSNLVGNRL